MTAAFASVSEVLSILKIMALLFTPCGRSRRALEDALVGSRTPVMRTWFGLERRALPTPEEY